MLIYKVIFILGIYAFKFSETSVRFTNLKCEDLDPAFSTFTKCQLKLVQRGTVSLSVHVKLFQLPVTNASLSLSLFKRFSGYRPFLYNGTVDVCEFLRRPKKNPFSIIFNKPLKEASNLNHSCPFNHDIIVKDLIIQDDKLKYFPLPTGDYMFQVKVGCYNVWRANVKTYVNVDLGFD